MKLPFKNSLLSWIMKKRIHQINLFLEHPFNVQKDVLTNLIDRSKNTDFGKDHNFHLIDSYEEFNQEIPVRSYEELFPYIQRSRDERENVLWPGKIKWFAKSSGTTNDRSKYIPISKESLAECHFKAGKDMLSLYCNNFPDTNLFNGKGLMLGGSRQKNIFKSYIDGDLSAILIQNFPFWVKIHKTPGEETALLEDWEKKIEDICIQSIPENVTNITGVPSWMFVLLTRILEKTGANNILEVWPELELYMHGGIDFQIYRKKFNKIIPTNNMNYLEVYNASEGFFAIQDQKDSKDLLLMLDYGIFYEFILLADLNQEKYSCVSLEDVRIGEIYAIVISTNGGLWRYLIGDTIRFTCLSPFRIRIVGRTKSFINSFGEELMVENADASINECCKKHSCSVRNYTAAPEFINDASGRHKWVIEFDSEPNNMQDFERDLDLLIRKINSDYDAKRSNDHVLSHLKIIVVYEGSFYKWLSKNKRLGGQYKVPRLTSDLSIINEIVNISNSLTEIKRY